MIPFHQSPLAQKYTLFLGLFVRCRSFAPLAILRQFYLASNEFFIFGAPVVNALAFGALQFYESYLGHAKGLYRIRLLDATTLRPGCSLKG